MCTYTCSYIGRMFLLVGKNVCKKTHRCLSSKDTHLADNGFININPCIIHTERQIATPHQNYYLFQYIFFTLHFLAPTTTSCLKSTEMPALERYLKLRYRLLGRVRKTTKAKLAGKNILHIKLFTLSPELNGAC